MHENMKHQPGTAHLTRRGATRLLLAGGAACWLGLGAGVAHAAQDKPEYVSRGLLAKNPIIEDMVLGKDDATITMVEYASATCGHCADFHIYEWPQIKKEYVDTGKVKFIFREFPLDQVALAAFMLTRCAAGGDTKKYFAVMDMVMKTQREWVKNPKEGLQKIMRLAGLSDEQFDKCLKDEALAKKIMNSARSASQAFKVRSTPTFFINGRKIAGRMRIEDFRAVIDEELKRASNEIGSRQTAGQGAEKTGKEKADDKAEAQ